MATPRFHVPGLASGPITLTGEEARHAARARRLAPDDPVCLFDGRGNEAEGRITVVGQNNVIVDLGSARHRPRPTPVLHLAFAPPKGPRQDVLIEKGTELGVAEFIPLRTERGVAEVSAHRARKWQRTATEAAKQSGQAWIPSFNGPVLAGELMGLLAEGTPTLLAVSAGDMAEQASPDGELAPTPIAALAGELARHAFVLGIVGPEGGFTPGELGTLVEAGARPISLGPNTLRIETAALALAAVVHSLQ